MSVDFPGKLVPLCLPKNLFLHPELVGLKKIRSISDVNYCNIEIVKWSVYIVLSIDVSTFGGVKC